MNTVKLLLTPSNTGEQVKLSSTGFRVLRFPFVSTEILETTSLRSVDAATESANSSSLLLL